MLTEPDDLLDTGIEVEAKPGGKNVKKLSLLSGGERSLTALAFLFAVFRSRPSPFYVMDEVEAALDDVNLHRFLGLVAEFRREAQLLIVSHQKRTMEAGDCLLGVTMQPGGSSKVIVERVTVPRGPIGSLAPSEFLARRDRTLRCRNTPIRRRRVFGAAYPHETLRCRKHSDSRRRTYRGGFRRPASTVLPCTACRRPRATRRRRPGRRSATSSARPCRGGLRTRSRRCRSDGVDEGFLETAHCTALLTWPNTSRSAARTNHGRASASGGGSGE